MNRRSVFRGTSGVALTIVGLSIGTASAAEPADVASPVLRQGGDTCATAFVIPSVPYQDIGTTVGYTNDYDAECPYDGMGPDVVYAYTPTEDQLVTITMCAPDSVTDYDTKIYVYRDICWFPAIACNDDACSTAAFPQPYVSQIEDVLLLAGHTHYIIVDGYGHSAGTYRLDITLAPTPPQCPPDALFGQNPDLPSANWHGATSAHTTTLDYLAYENFELLPQELNGVHWFGLVLQLDSWTNCQPEYLTFEIAFYADSGGVPGPAYCTQTVSPLITDTGQLYTGYHMYRFDVALPNGCFIQSPGWISIQSQLNPNDCAFVWLSSPAGDGMSLQRGNPSSPPYVSDYDLSVCLSTTFLPPWGACCNDAAGECTDWVIPADCLPPGRYAANKLCAELNPPCGQMPGACCHPDGTCAVVVPSACADNWLGPNTLCASCPCILTCPPGSIPEPEACGAATDDGCNITPAAFAPIAPGQTACGTYWSSGSARDTDWYELVTTQALALTWTARGTSPLALMIYNGSAGCSNPTLVATGNGPACTDVTIATTCLDPGTYWCWIGSSQFVNHPCAQTYVATLSTTVCDTVGACCFANGTCRGPLRESTCEDQGGTWQGPGTACDPNPCPPCTPDFVVAAPGSWSGNTCGAGHTCNLQPSENQLWEVTIPFSGLWRVSLCGTTWDTYMYVGATCCGTEIGYNDDGCTQGNTLASQLVTVVDAGVYYIDVAAYSASVCGEYVLQVLDVPPCPIPPDDCMPEGEPRCGPNYDDQYNGGCGSTPPVFTVATLGFPICGEGGTFTYYSSESRDTDWYEATVSEWSTIHFTVEAQFPVLLGIAEQYEPGGPGCENMTGYLDPFASVDECTPTTLTQSCCPPGTYYFYVSPSGFSGIPCGLPYVATITAEPSSCRGACCVAATDCRENLSLGDCTAQGGQWLGPDTSCVLNPCSPFMCAAGSQICDEHISNVALGEFSNPSACSTGGYADYTNLCLPVEVGQSYELTITNGEPYAADQCGVWIDWNHNFELDPGETLAVSGSPGVGPYTATITPPAEAYIGDTRLRIRITYTGAVEPCGQTYYGEVEDYCVRIGWPICGDFNADGQVNVDDYYAILDTFGTCAPNPKFLAAADFDGDGCITLADYQAWVQCYAAANGGAVFRPPGSRNEPRPAAPRGAARALSS